jgi:hypothetical protein
MLIEEPASSGSKEEEVGKSLRPELPAPSVLLPTDRHRHLRDIPTHRNGKIPGEFIVGGEILRTGKREYALPLTPPKSE